MKILMTTDTVGGVWTYSLQLARALQTHDVTVCLAAKGRPTAEQTAAAESLPNVSLQVSDFQLEWMDDPWDDVTAAGDWLLEVSRATQPAVIHLNDYCHAALPWNAPTLVVGHSCVLSWMDAVRGTPAPPQYQRYAQQVQHGLRAADLVVAPTREMLRVLAKFYGPFAAERVIWNGCDSESFHCSDPKQPFVFSAGRFWDDAKNLRSLSAAAPDLDWPVRVAGLAHPDGEDGRADHVQWLGSLSSQQMRQTYADAAIYALPARYEPFGLTVLEAAMSRCALVLGDIPTLREIWGECACYVGPDDVAELSRAVNQLIADRDKREELAERAFERSQKLTAHSMAASYADCYRRMATNHQSLTT